MFFGIPSSPQRRGLQKTFVSEHCVYFPITHILRRRREVVSHVDV